MFMSDEVVKQPSACKDVVLNTIVGYVDNAMLWISLEEVVWECFIRYALKP